jgi:catechol 2,3-dioxygenase-like lactoylglutathione lyase family enzyme
VFDGAHVILYSPAADEDRAFLRDHFGFANVDAGHGWLIFKLPPAEVAVHPTEDRPHHELYFMCHDLEARLATLTEAGATVSAPVTEQRWGRIAEISLPSGTRLGIYEPRHPVAYDL